MKAILLSALALIAGSGTRTAPQPAAAQRVTGDYVEVRTASVFAPRRTSQQSSGPGTAPSDFCRK